jgi:hypothetical protein
MIISHFAPLWWLFFWYIHDDYFNSFFCEDDYLNSSYILRDCGPLITYRGLQTTTYIIIYQEICTITIISCICCFQFLSVRRNITILIIDLSKIYLLHEGAWRHWLSLFEGTEPFLIIDPSKIYLLLEGAWRHWLERRETGAG